MLFRQIGEQWTEKFLLLRLQGLLPITHIYCTHFMCLFMTLIVSFDKDTKLYTHKHTHTHTHTRLTCITYQTVYPPSSHSLNILNTQLQNISY